MLNGAGPSDHGRSLANTRSMTRPEDEVARVQCLIAAGQNASQIARSTGIPRSTIRDWRLHGAPTGRTGRPGKSPCQRCGRSRSLPLVAAYAYPAWALSGRRMHLQAPPHIQAPDHTRRGVSGDHQPCRNGDRSHPTSGASADRPSRLRTLRRGVYVLAALAMSVPAARTG